MPGNAGAVAAVVGRRRDRAIDLGPLPKLKWVEVYDQKRLHRMHKIPVPRLFQRGQEHCGKLTHEAVFRWLSRSLEKKVTAVYTGTAPPVAKNGSIVGAWSLAEFDPEAESPFVDGVAIVCCCNGEDLRPELQPQRSEAEAPMRGEKTAPWRRAVARVRIVSAFAQPWRIRERSMSRDSDWRSETAGELPAEVDAQPSPMEAVPSGTSCGVEGRLGPKSAAIYRSSSKVSACVSDTGPDAAGLPEVAETWTQTNPEPPPPRPPEMRDAGTCTDPEPPAAPVVVHEECPRCRAADAAAAAVAAAAAAAAAAEVRAPAPARPPPPPPPVSWWGAVLTGCAPPDRTLCRGRRAEGDDDGGAPIRMVA